MDHRPRFKPKTMELLKENREHLSDLQLGRDYQIQKKPDPPPKEKLDTLKLQTL